MTPIDDVVKVKLFPDNETTSSGIAVIQTNEVQQYKRGTVVALGTGKVNAKGEVLPMAVQLNDIVIVDITDGNEVNSERDHFLYIREDKIIGIVEQ